MPDPPTSPEPIPFKPARSGCCQYNVPILVLIHLGVIGHFPMLFARRLPQLKVEIGADRLQILVAGLISFSPTLTGIYAVSPILASPLASFCTRKFLHP